MLSCRALDSLDVVRRDAIEFGDGARRQMSEDDQACKLVGQRHQAHILPVDQYEASGSEEPVVTVQVAVAVHDDRIDQIGLAGLSARTLQPALGRREPFVASRDLAHAIEARVTPVRRLILGHVMQSDSRHDLPKCRVVMDTANDLDEVGRAFLYFLCLEWAAAYVLHRDKVPLATGLGIAVEVRGKRLTHERRQRAYGKSLASAATSGPGKTERQSASKGRSSFGAPFCQYINSSNMAATIPQT